MKKLFIYTLPLLLVTVLATGCISKNSLLGTWEGGTGGEDWSDEYTVIFTDQTIDINIRRCVSPPEICNVKHFVADYTIDSQTLSTAKVQLKNIQVLSPTQANADTLESINEEFNPLEISFGKNETGKYLMLNEAILYN